MDNYKNCVCVFLSKGNGDVLSQRNAGRCVKIGSILNLLLQEGGVPAGGGGTVSYTHLTLPTICSV